MSHICCVSITGQSIFWMVSSQVTWVICLLVGCHYCLASPRLLPTTGFRAGSGKVWDSSHTSTSWSAQNHATTIFLRNAILVFYRTNIDYSGCKCVIVGNMIFNSKCARNCLSVELHLDPLGSSLCSPKLPYRIWIGKGHKGKGGKGMYGRGRMGKGKGKRGWKWTRFHTGTFFPLPTLAGHHCPLASTTLCCLAIEIHGCEQLA